MIYVYYKDKADNLVKCEVDIEQDELHESYPSIVSQAINYGANSAVLAVVK